MIYIQYQNYVTWYKLLFMMIEKTMICLALFCLSVSAWVTLLGLYFAILHKPSLIGFNMDLNIAVCVHHKNKVSAPGTVVLSLFASGPTGTDACIDLESRLVTAVWINDTPWIKHSITTQWSMLSYSSVTVAFPETRDPVTADTKFSWLPFPKPPSQHF